MRAHRTPVEFPRTSTLKDIEMWSLVAAALAAAAYGRRRYSVSPLWLALAASPAAYRAITGIWPAPMLALRGRSDDTRSALAGSGGLGVRESAELSVPVAEVYAFWRQLENLPRFMRHLVRVTETAEGQSHWVARGPAGVDVGWDAELVNDIPDRLIAWRSLPGSDVVTAGSVRFQPIRGGPPDPRDRHPAVRPARRAARRVGGAAVRPGAVADHPRGPRPAEPAARSCRAARTSVPRRTDAAMTSPAVTR